MSESSPQAVTAALSRALHRIRSTPPRIIASPATQPRRAAVALIVRISPAADAVIEPPLAQPSLTEFFALDWVKNPAAQAEILFLRREHPDQDRTVSQNRPRNTEDAHVAFPGGRQEEGDEGGLYTAMRQTWEEIGVDLAERDFLLVGQLDDREITTSLGKRLLMILSPFVFLQVSPRTPTPDPTPGTRLHWIPVASLLASTFPSPPIGNAASGAIVAKRQRKALRQRQWTTVTVDIASRMGNKNYWLLRLGVRLLIGSMQFNAILLESNSGADANGASLTLNEKVEKEEHALATRNRGKETLKLWGLSLGMTLDLLSFMDPPSSPNAEDYPHDEVSGLGTSIAPSMTSVLPRFSHPDVNFWIWVFGRRYREVLRAWAEASARSVQSSQHTTTGFSANDRRINWSGTAVNQFYAAVRKALVVVLVLRSIGILVALGIGGWWVFFR